MRFYTSRQVLEILTAAEEQTLIDGPSTSTVDVSKADASCADPVNKFEMVI